ncbi:GT-D fold domain-containing glycosyltransferase [Halopiger aswanensis]|uniref:Uncharacterized protein DUF1792 n=1 Tax=Halopiger aswanensis TaxID=148449 RepID=A0A419WRG1_9EURY|nr:GT-D fold domain-containing glycosyltransferase [Halopiger aswanensis]RKD98049.1 uncharacterized protein DUF1792 [Halopiger aswanensis]
MPSISERIQQAYASGGLTHLSKLAFSHLTRTATYHGRLAYYNLKAPHKLAYTEHDILTLSEWETLQYLEANDVGIARFGDGELTYLLGKNTSHDPQYPPLRKKVRQVLSTYSNDTSTNQYLVTLPIDVTLGDYYSKHNTDPSAWSYDKRYAMIPFLKKGVPYGSQFCFRKGEVAHNVGEYKEKLIQLFSEKDLLYVTDKNRFSEDIEISEVIEIPPESEIDAFYIYDNIKERAIKAYERHHNPLILISAGVTATALSAELNAEGYRTYDIGKLYKML